MSSLRNSIIAVLALMLAACVSSPERPAPTHRPNRPPVFVPAPKPTPKPAPRPVAPAPASSDAPAPALVQSIKAIWAADPGRTGIAIVPSNGGWSIEYRGSELMPQQSVSKLWVAITVMDGVDKGRFKLSDPVTVMPSDIVVFSAAMQALVGTEGYRTTLGELMTRQMTKSDNTANDFLLRTVGGPAAVRAMISAKGLGAIRFGPGENLLQAGTAGLPWQEAYRSGKSFQAARALLSDSARAAAMTSYLADPPDGAAPLAIAKALIRLKRGELLSPDSTRHLLALMAASETGKQRLRAGVPAGWGFAHKTGTGQDFMGRTAGYNDVGIMTAPDGTSYAVVVMMAETSIPIIKRMETMQGISASVGANHR